MTEAIVDQFEVVDVEHDGGEILGRVAPGARELLLSLIKEITTVMHGGERIGNGQALRLLKQTSILQRHSHLIGKGLCHLRLVRAKACGLDVCQFHQTDEAIMHYQGHSQPGTHALRGRPGYEGRLRPQFSNEDRPPPLNHFTCWSLK